MSERIAVSLRNDVYANIIRKDISFFDSNKTGVLVSRLNSDTSVVQDTLSTSVSILVRALTIIIASIVVLFIMSPILAATLSIGIIPIVGLSICYGRYMRTL